MYIRQWQPDDIQQLHEWQFKRGLTPVPAEDLPKLGLIIPEVGMAFVRMAEGNLGIFDSLITNPEAPSEVRHKALEILFPATIAVAQNAGCTRIWGITINNGAFMRASQHGFQLSPCVLMVRE